MKNSMKNSACSSGYATPAPFSKARNSIETGSNQVDDYDNDESTGGGLKAVLNIDPQLKEKFNKMKSGNQPNLVDDESEPDIDDE